MQATDALEVILRFAAALSLTTAAILLGHGLVRGLLRPPQAWLYATIVVASVAAWRWVVVWLALEAHAGVASSLAPWVQQINQTLFALIGVTICVLVVVGRRRRHDDP